jgi:aminocarboxymuconate-semialdehyde decarboxylase
MAALVTRHPDRLCLVASVPLQDPVLAAAELQYAVRTLDARAVQIGTNVQGKHLDGEEFDPFWATAQELGVLVTLHPGNMGAYPALENYHLGIVLTYPFDTAVTAASLICGGVLERYPNVRISLPHGGGLLTYQITRLENAYKTGMMPQTLQHSPLEYFKRFYFDTVLDDSQALAFLIDKVGGDRLMMGTDYPFEMRIDGVRTVETIPGLSATERNQIVSGTACNLLRVGVPAR